ncbi:MAG: DUF4931 domain-containing protein [Negativicutes bacterium]|nr:DUF4931 domain-containing protein [Negativicutes bacterium]
MPNNKTHLLFDTSIGMTKPVTIGNQHEGCPFCSKNLLAGIIAEDGPILLVVNKYPVLRDSFQTVLIETDDCHSEMSVYPKDHLYRVFRFGMEQWQKLIQSGQYESVIFYKNHGPYSGGTIHHPHMQIVGLKHIDYSRNIVRKSFEGDVICQQDGVELNLATEPRIGFMEFNIKLDGLGHLNLMADYIQMVVHYLLHHFHKSCNSYNLFFYQLDGKIFAKIMPRFVTSPLYIGYSIPQVSTRAQEVLKEIRSIYLKQ